MAKNKLELVGHVGVDSGQVLIVDPCYISQWVPESETNRGEFWGGDKVAVAARLKEVYPELVLEKKPTGQIMIRANSEVSGPGIVERIKHVMKAYDLNGLAYQEKGDSSYWECCDQTLTEKGAGTVMGGLALASTTGVGDGVYPVYAERDQDGRIMALTIRFQD